MGYRPRSYSTTAVLRRSAPPGLTFPAGTASRRRAASHTHPLTSALVLSHTCVSITPPPVFRVLSRRVDVGYGTCYKDLWRYSQLQSLPRNISCAWHTPCCFAAVDIEFSLDIRALRHSAYRPWCCLLPPEFCRPVAAARAAPTCCFVTAASEFLGGLAVAVLCAYAWRLRY
jgi:hypothetical protein